MLLLLASLATLAPPRQAEGLRTLELTAVEQPWLPTSPRRALRARHALEGDLVLDGLRFAVQEDGRALRIATRPDGEGLRRVRGGQRVRLEWAGGAEPRTIELLLEQEGGGWRWGAARAMRLALDGAELVLVDVDADGRLDLLRDGWSLAPGAPVLPLGSTLRLEDRVLRVERLDPTGASIELRAERPDLPRETLAALRTLNHLRLGEGLEPVTFDPALSADCASHAAYLAARGWRGGPGGRDQEPGAEGATRAGREAALRSAVLPCSPREAMLELWSDLKGRLLLTDPELTSVGIAGGPGPVAVIDARARATRREGAATLYTDPRPSPAHGAPGVPTGHASLAVTTPVETAARMGPPILLLLGREAGGVEAYELELLEVESGRKRLAVELLPPLVAHPGVRGGLPERPLAPGRLHLAHHRWVRDGEPRELLVRFRTAPGR